MEHNKIGEKPQAVKDKNHHVKNCYNHIEIYHSTKLTQKSVWE